MTVFVSGVHGVGKSFLCQQYANNHLVRYEGASGLIRKERAQANWSTDKRVGNIDDNQLALKSAVQKIVAAGHALLLDGHFVLINDRSEFVALESSVFKDIGITGVVVLEADTRVIASRLAARDSSKSVVDIDSFLDLERAQAQCVCQELSVPLRILKQPEYSEFSKVVNDFFEGNL